MENVPKRRSAGLNDRADSPDRYVVPLLVKSLDVLEAFGPDEELTLQEVITRTRVSHTTAFRILFTLVRRGYLSQRSKKYRLSLVRETVKIGYGALADTVAISTAIRGGLQESAKAAAIDLLILDNKADPKVAIQNAQTFVAERVNLAIEFQNNAEAAPIIADVLNTAGIPTIAIHIPQPAAVYFGPDNYRAGWTAGQALAHYACEHWGGRCDLLLLLDIRLGGHVLQARMTGVIGGLESVAGAISSSRVVRVDASGGREDAYRMTSAILRRRSRASKILISAASDELALGAFDAVQVMGLGSNRVAIVGHDGTEEAQRVISTPGSPFIGTVTFFPEQYGRRLIHLAQRILKGDQVPPFVYVPHQLIDHHNVTP